MMGNSVLQERVLEQERLIRSQREAVEEAQHSAKLIREAQDVERRLQQQLQHMQCEHEKLKRENRTLKETLMNTAQQSVDRDEAIARDKKHYDALLRDVKLATRNAQDCKYLAQMEKERRIAQVMQLKGQLTQAQRKLSEQQAVFDMRQYGLSLGRERPNPLMTLDAFVAWR